MGVEGDWGLPPPPKKIFLWQMLPPEYFQNVCKWRKRLEREKEKNSSVIVRKGVDKKTSRFFGICRLK